jgi:hypothetical protein
MSQTVIYKGWINVLPPRNGRDATVVLTPSRFFYRAKKHVIAEKIAQDKTEHGQFIGIRVWAAYYRMRPVRRHRVLSSMGVIDAEYSEITGANDDYRYTIQFIKINSDFNLLEELARFYHHYCIIEITYSSTEYDMIAHELERILLLNHDE